jgi:hypothetical protein
MSDQNRPSSSDEGHNGGAASIPEVDLAALR